MTALRTARARARDEITREITEAGRRQLAEVGAAALSLRAVARELGMVSSALYRYVASRDELLTVLIVASYDSLADAAEEAVAPVPAGAHRQRWLATCAAVRRWAVAHPHEWALVYGSPVPGYRAPQDTIAPAARVMLAFVSVVADADAAGALAAPAAPPPDGALHEQLRGVAIEFAPGLPEPVVARIVFVFSQLLGMISMELYGHFVGSFEPAEHFFAHAAEQGADLLGLAPAG